MRVLREHFLIVGRSHIYVVIDVVLANTAHHDGEFLVFIVHERDRISLFDPQEVAHLLVNDDRLVSRRKTREVANLSVAAKSVSPWIQTDIILRNRMEVRGAGHR